MKKSHEYTKDDIRIPPYESMETIKIDSPAVEDYEYATLKLDGNWTAVYKSAAGQVSVWTRKNNNITAAVDQNLWYHSIRLYCPKGWYFGELWKNGVPCSSISTHLAKKKPLEFILFGMNSFHLTTMSAFKTFCDDAGLRSVPYLFNPKKGNFRDTSWEFYQKTKIAYRPTDGIVFCDGPGLNCRKWKPASTIDLIYVGYELGMGKNKYLPGKVLCKTSENIPVCKASGLSQAERRYIQKNDKELRGKVLEVKYMGITAKGRLRHASFVRFRDDKTADCCSYYQDPDLAQYWKK